MAREDFLGASADGNTDGITFDMERRGWYSNIALNVNNIEHRMDNKQQSIVACTVNCQRLR